MTAPPAASAAAKSAAASPVPVAETCLAKAAASARKKPPRTGHDDVVFETEGTDPDGSVVVYVLTGRHLFACLGRDDQRWLHDESARAELGHGLKVVPLETIESAEWTSLAPDSLTVCSAGVTHSLLWLGSREDRQKLMLYLVRLARGGDPSSAAAESVPMSLWDRIKPVLIFLLLPLVMGGLLLGAWAAGGDDDAAPRVGRAARAGAIAEAGPWAIALFVAVVLGVVMFVVRDRLFGPTAQTATRHRVTWPT